MDIHSWCSYAMRLGADLAVRRVEQVGDDPSGCGRRSLGSLERAACDNPGPGFSRSGFIGPHAVALQPQALAGHVKQARLQGRRGWG